MDAYECGILTERVARENDAGNEMAAAYVAGYADGITLLHSDGHQAPVGPLERIYARYLRYVELEPPTPEAHSYVAGFRDAAADNLPCPPHEPEPQIHRVAA